MYINVIMMMLATIAAYLTLDYAREIRTAGSNKRYIVVLGVFSFIRIMFCGLMGIADSTGYALVFRAIGIVGFDLFMTTEILFMLNQCSIRKNSTILIHFLYTVFGATDIIFFSLPEVVTLTRVGQRTICSANKGWQNSYHHIFLCVIAASLFFSLFFFKREKNYRRQERYIVLIFISNLALLLSTLPDVFLPKLGIAPIPSSAMGTFVNYCIILYVDKKYAAFEMTENNLESYIYDYGFSGVMAFDLKCHLVEANRYARHLFGLSYIAPGMRLSDIFDMDEGTETELLNDVLAGNDRQTRLTVHNGGKEALVNLHLEKDENKMAFCIFATVIDLTRENNMLKELKKLDESRTAFLSNMSHEIRTPVNTIQGMNEVILRDCSDPRIINYASSIQSSCRLLISIIDDILDFSRIESGELELNEASYCIKDVINDLVNLLEERTAKKGLSMKTEIDSHIPDKMYGDANRIRQILTNLLTNAVKYTDYGVVTLKIADGGRNGDVINLCMDVTDTGKGIRKEDQFRLFQAFSRVDEKRNRHIEGTGLGLSITSHFVSMMNGQISVESEYGRGSDFRVVIPQRIMSQEEIGDYRLKEEAGSTSTREEGLIAPDAKLLLVDDNEMNLKVVKHLLKETCMQIDAVLSGREAVKLATENRYDVILLDHMMPEMDGIDTLKAIKKDSVNQNTPIIVLTANAIAGAKEMYMRAGFDDYLSKPVKGNTLVEMLKKWLPGELIVTGEVKV